MTVARWEFWSVANMMVSAHGANAPDAVAERLRLAEQEGASGAIVVWKEIAKHVTEIMRNRFGPKHDPV